MVNVMQQVGGSLGLSVLVAVFGTARRSVLTHPVPGLSAAALQQHALAHGMSAAFTLAAVFDVVTLLLIIALLRSRPPAVATPGHRSGDDDGDRRVRVPDLPEASDAG